MPLGHVLAQFWAKLESTFDTATAFTAADAINVEELSISPSFDWEVINEHVGTASLQSECAGVEGGEWSAVCFIQPGAQGDDYAPDISAILEAAFGTLTQVASTSSTYTFSDTAANSLQLGRRVAGTGNDYLWEGANGAWVETGELSWDGGSMPRLTLSGGFASYEFVMGAPTVGGAEAAGQTTITITAGDIYKIRTNGNMLVAFGTSDNGGAGYAVTAVDYSASEITISPAIQTGEDLAGGEQVIPFALSQTIATTNKLCGVNGDLQIDATSVGMTVSNLSWSTGLMPIQNEGTASKATGVVLAERRSIELELNAYFRDEHGAHLGAAWQRSPVLRDISQRIGVATAGSRMTINTPAVRIGVSPLELPDADVAQIVLAGIARQDATAGDELSLVFN